MKKFVFAVQVFGIIALFPIYVILEMNHGTTGLPNNMRRPVGNEKIMETVIHASLNSEAQNENPVRLKYLWVQEPWLAKMK